MASNAPVVGSYRDIVDASESPIKHASPMKAQHVHSSNRLSRVSTSIDGTCTLGKSRQIGTHFSRLCMKNKHIMSREDPDRWYPYEQLINSGDAAITVGLCRMAITRQRQNDQAHYRCTPGNTVPVSGSLGEHDSLLLHGQSNFGGDDAARRLLENLSARTPNPSTRVAVTELLTGASDNIPSFHTTERQQRPNKATIAPYHPRPTSAPSTPRQTGSRMHDAACTPRDA